MNQLIGHKDRKHSQSKFKLTLHVLFYILIFTHVTDGTKCAKLQKSADRKQTLTLICHTKCLSAYTAQHFVHSLVTFVLFFMRALEKNICMHHF